MTTCRWGCDETWYAYGTNATCLTDKDVGIAGIRPSQFNEWIRVIQTAIDGAFPTMMDRLFVFVIMATATGTIMAYKVNWQFGIMTIGLIMLWGTMTGWVPFYITIIIGVIGVILWAQKDLPKWTGLK
jgi:hypothetical protein